MNSVLCNRLNKEEAFKRLACEDFERKTISFYGYKKIHNVEALRDELYLAWEKMGCLGRIYLAPEGINAQMSVPKPQWENFVNHLETYEIFKNIPFKKALEENADSFWKLSIKIKPKIVADGIDDPSFDASDTGEHLDAESFNQMLEDKDSVCMDMRNFYESEIGYFKGAIRPKSSTFREELPMAKEALKGKENKPVLLYCTGGIRCEKASSYLRHNGFKKVYQLHGGIIQYAHEVKEKNLDNKFVGKNFVFDNRIGERVTSDIVSSCHQCGDACDEHTNCANKACNLLFIQCQKCKDKYNTTCSQNCKKIASLSEEEQKKAWKKFIKPDTLSLSKKGLE